MTGQRPTPDARPLLWLGLGAIAIAGVAGAAALARQSARPDSASDSAPGRTARRSRFGRFAVVGRTVTIHRPRHEIYAFWRDVTNLRAVMEDAVEISDTGDGVTRWAISAGAGVTVTADTRVVYDRPGEEIAWRSVEGSQIETEGKISFRDAPGDRGTEVEAIIAFVPPMGRLGQMVARVTAQDPETLGRRALKRLKMVMETGEIATARNRTDAAQP